MFLQLLPVILDSGDSFLVAAITSEIQSDLRFRACPRHQDAVVSALLEKGMIENAAMSPVQTDGFPFYIP